MKIHGKHGKVDAVPAAALPERPERMFMLLALLVALLHVGVWILLFPEPPPPLVNDNHAVPFKLQVAMIPARKGPVDSPAPATESQAKPQAAQQASRQAAKTAKKPADPHPPLSDKPMDNGELQRIIAAHPHPQVSSAVKPLPGGRVSQAVSSAVFPAHTGSPNAKDNFPQSDERNPSPEYPEMALFLGYQGTTVARVQVSGNGASKGVEIVRSSSHKLLDDAVVKALRQWRFTATHHDDAVIILVNFIIHG